MQNVPLARGLFEDGQEGQYIPVDLIEDVAEVLRWVYELEGEENGDREQDDPDESS